MILRQRRRRRRLPWDQAFSLEGVLVETDHDAAPLGRTVTTADLHRRLGTVSHNHVDRHDEAAALDDAMRSLSPRLRKVCRQLADGSVHAAARRLNTSRRQLRNAMRRIRRPAPLTTSSS